MSNPMNIVSQMYGAAKDAVQTGAQIVKANTIAAGNTIANGAIAVAQGGQRVVNIVTTNNGGDNAYEVVSAKATAIANAAGEKINNGINAIAAKFKQAETALIGDQIGDVRYGGYRFQVTKTEIPMLHKTFNPIEIPADASKVRSVPTTVVNRLAKAHTVVSASSDTISQKVAEVTYNISKVILSIFSLGTVFLIMNKNTENEVAPVRVIVEALSLGIATLARFVTIVAIQAIGQGLVITADAIALGLAITTAIVGGVIYYLALPILNRIEIEKLKTENTALHQQINNITGQVNEIDGDLANVEEVVAEQIENEEAANTPAPSSPIVRAAKTTVKAAAVVLGSLGTAYAIQTVFDMASPYIATAIASVI